MRRAVGFVFAGLLGCDPEPLRLEFGDDPRVALVSLTPDGRVMQATRLVDPFEETLFAPSAVERVVAYEWSAEAPGVGLGEGQSGPLTGVFGCDPRLPPPRRVHPVRGTPPTGAPPPVGAAWLEGACPQPPDPDALVLELPCHVQNRCPTDVQALGPCRFRFDLARCSLGQVDIAVDDRGTACVLNAGPSDRNGAPCSSAQPNEEALGAAECEFRLANDRSRVCRVEIGVEPDPAPFMTPEVVLLHDQEPGVPGFTRTFGLLAPSDVDESRAPDFALTSSLAVVASFEPLGGVPRRACGEGARDHEVALRTFGRRSLRPGPVWSVPPCTAWLSATSDESGVYVAFPNGRDGRWAIARLNGTGQEVRRMDLPERYRLDNSELREIETGRDAVAVLFVQGDRSFVERLDPETLSPLGSPLEAPGESQQLGLSENTLVLASEASSGRLFRGVGGFDEEVRYQGPAVFLMDAVHDLPTGTSVVAVSRDVFGLLVWGAELVVVERPGPLPFQPTRVAPWKSRPGRVLVTAYAQDPQGRWRSILSRLDIVSGRLLPGSVELGPGAPTRLRVESDGTAWVLLGWAGRLVRVTPR